MSAAHKKIHSGDCPVSDDHSKESKGQQWVEERGHHVADGSGKQKQKQKETMS